MQEKDIKRLVTKQLKKEFPGFRRLTKRQEKALAEKVISEVMASYKPGQAMDVPIHEGTNTPATPADIIPLSEMGAFIEDRTRGFLPFTKHCHQRYLDDQELHLIAASAGKREINQNTSSVNGCIV